MSQAKRIVPNSGNPFAGGLARVEAAHKRSTGRENPVVRITALQLEREIKLMLSKPGSGREYWFAKGKKKRASAPGEPPAVRKGDLRRSIAHEFADRAARTGTNMHYAKLLEFGTETMEPRPFMRPSWDNVKVKAIDPIVEALRAEMRKNAGVAT